MDRRTRRAEPGVEGIVYDHSVPEHRMIVWVVEREPERDREQARRLRRQFGFAGVGAAHDQRKFGKYGIVDGEVFQPDGCRREAQLQDDQARVMLFEPDAGQPGILDLCELRRRESISYPARRFARWPSFGGAENISMNDEAEAADSVKADRSVELCAGQILTVALRTTTCADAGQAARR